MITCYGIFAVRDGKVLVIRQKSGNHWTLCKGGAKSGEKPWDTAIRELKEETNMVVKQKLTWRRYMHRYTMDRGMKKEVHYFPAEVTGEVVIDYKEVNDYKWVNPSEVASVLTYESDQKVAEEIMHAMHMI